MISSLVAQGASAQDAPWTSIANGVGQFHSLGTLGQVTVQHVSVTSVTPRSGRGVFDLHHGTLANGADPSRDCPADRYLAVMPDLENIPSWALPDVAGCRPAKSSSLDRLIPRISIEGSFFSIGYGVELDKESRGLLIDYGAFTFGIGDSPNGAAVFNGAKFHIPRWFPGSALVPQRIREELQFDVGLSLPLDTIDVRRWRPQLGIGVTLARW